MDSITTEERPIKRVETIPSREGRAMTLIEYADGGGKIELRTVNKHISFLLSARDFTQVGRFFARTDA